MTSPENDAPSPTDTILSEDYISGDEWAVEDILAERVMKGNALGRPAGERCWLVKWSGFELADSTWEPREHLNDVLIGRWEEDQKEYVAGARKPFKVRSWKQAYLKHWAEKIRKQEECNRQRARNGDEPSPVDDFEHIRESLKSVDSENDSDEDVDWTRLDQRAAFQEDSSDSCSDSTREDTPESSNRNEGLNLDKSPSGNNPKGASVTRSGNPSPDGRRESTSAKKRQDTTQVVTSSRKRTASRLEAKIVPPAEIETQEETHHHRQTAAEPQSRPHKRKVPNTPSVLTQKVASEPSARPPAASTSSISAGTSLDTSRRPATLRAIMSRPVNPSEIGNVFTGGKKPRQRPTLDQAATSSGAAPKLLKPRLQNILQKRARDNEGTRDPRRASSSNLNVIADRAPVDLMQAEPSLFVTPDPELDPWSDTMPLDDSPLNTMEQNIKSTELSQRREQSPSSVHEQAHTQTAGASFNAASLNDVNNKKRHRVRFESDEPTAMDLDTDGQSADATCPGLATMPSNVQTTLTDVTKPCQLGRSVPQCLRIIFQGLSSESLASHLVAFQNSPRLLFTHQCVEEDFVRHSDRLRAHVTAEGFTQGFDEATSLQLQRVNERLLQPSQALLCYLEDLCVMLVPNRSPRPRLGQTELHSASILRNPAFVIFRPAKTFGARTLDQTDTELTPASRSSTPRKLFEMDMFLRFTCERLLPVNLLGQNQASFFLLFPQSLEPECLLLAQWLRQSHPTPGILSSIIEGDWSRFRALSRGVVIAHQDAVATMRLLPGIGELLWSPDSVDNFSFWTFGTSSQKCAPDGWADSGNLELVKDSISLRPLLPAGSVFLITPSFLLAQPDHAYGFLKWFSQSFVESKPPKEPICKLALFAEPECWLRDLLVDEATSEDKYAVRQKTCRLLTKLSSRHDEDDQDLLTSLLVLAPASIDGNDEQSLVNWFSWWALNHLDMFRRFEVLGTGHSDRFLLSRRVRAPHYQSSSIPDPGAPKYDDADENDAPVQRLRTSMVPAPELRLAGATMQDYLRSLHDDRVSTMPLAILFNRPVSHYGPGMAVHLGDAGSQLATFDEWFSFFRPLNEIRGTKNTYFGLFYTIQEGWNPDAHPADLPTPTRPWIAIFRPQNPNRKPWTSTELFIWDAFLSLKFSESDEIYESDLIPAQQALLEIVGKRNSQRNAHAPLKKVWIGGFESSDPSAQPLKHTLERVKHFFENFRSDLHARSDLLPTCGWKEVIPGLRPEERLLNSEKPKVERPTRFDVGESDAEDDRADRKIVFHPPNGNKKLYSRQIENRLLKEVQKAKRAGKGSNFDFQFATTLVWYGHLKNSKRHSEHIRVVQWTTTFKELGIPIRQN